MDDHAPTNDKSNLELDGNYRVAIESAESEVNHVEHRAGKTAENHAALTSEEGKPSELDGNCEIDPDVLAASGAACCDLKPCNKETLLTRDVTSPKDQIVDLLSEGDGENAVTIAAAVPYSPLRVPSLAGDEPFQVPAVLNNDGHLLPPDHYVQSMFRVITHEAAGGLGAEVQILEQRADYSPLSESSASIKTANSSFGIETDICRICHLGHEQSGIRLVSPCLCSGTVAFTHHSCLTKWLAECGSTNCELCGYRFRFRNITAFRLTKLKTISITSLDRLHLLLTLCTILFLAGTSLYVFWVSFSDHPVATSDRESMASQILLPVYATLDAMAIFLLIFEFKHTIWRLWCKWRVLNLGVVIDDRETRTRNHLNEIRLKEQRIAGITNFAQSPERNQLIQQERPDHQADDGGTRAVCEIFNDIFEPEVVEVEGGDREQNESLSAGISQYGNRL